MSQYIVEHDDVLNYFSVVGAIEMKNKCCDGRPVLITKTNGVDVWSCQCACGGWCTNGCFSIPDAVAEWERINK